MSFFQSMPDTINRYSVILQEGKPILFTDSVSDMKNTTGRSAFGARLYLARKFAKKTQIEAAKAVGMSQGTLGELEREGQGSSYTPQLAEFYKVSSVWLATGKGNGPGEDALESEIERLTVKLISYKNFRMGEMVACGVTDPLKIIKTNPNASRQLLHLHEQVEETARTLDRLKDEFRARESGLLPFADTDALFSGAESNLDEAPVLRPPRLIPVVGEVQGGVDGYLQELAYPVGHGEGFVEYRSRDANAYALRVRGDSMHPRYRAGEFVIIEPNTEPPAGEDVVVCCKDGRKMLKVLNWIRDGEAQFLSVNNGYAPLTMLLEDIESIQLAAGRAPRSAFIKG